MTETFDWRVTADSSGGGEFKVSTTQFGDGYKQEVPNGINNEVQKWSVQYVGTHAEVAEVLAFIRLHAGATPFFWTPPFGLVGYYTCKKYSPGDHGGDTFTLSMEFEQGYKP